MKKIAILRLDRMFASMTGSDFIDFERLLKALLKKHQLQVCESPWRRNWEEIFIELDDSEQLPFEFVRELFVLLRDTEITTTSYIHNAGSVWFEVIGEE